MWERKFHAQFAYVRSKKEMSKLSYHAFTLFIGTASETGFLRIPNAQFANTTLNNIYTSDPLLI